MLIRRRLLSGLLTILYCTGFGLFSLPGHAQTSPRVEVRNLLNAINNYTNTLPPEKVYVQTDRSDYETSDTIWFKVYLFDAAALSSPSKSGIVYIELADEQNVVVKRAMVNMRTGLGWGNINLQGLELPDGYYTFRAYTNWMLNFTDSYIFKKRLAIGSRAPRHLLISPQFGLKLVDDKQNVAAALQLTTVGGEFTGPKLFSMSVKEQGKLLLKDEVESAANGSLNFNFNLPGKADPGQLTITLQEKRAAGKDDPQLSVPVRLNRPEKIDLQFMPEGGTLLAGTTAHIAFKALAEDGYGTAVTGYIYNSRNEQVTAFTSLHKGMGSFYLPIERGESYTARILLPDGGYSKSYFLPVSKQTGTSLSIRNGFKTDSLEISIAFSPDLTGADQSYYLLAQSRGVGCYAAVVRPDLPVKKIVVSKTLFPTGIARFSLLSAEKIPLNERIVYVDLNDKLQLSAQADKKVYNRRDSVSMVINASTCSGLPVSGSFSVSITDDGQVKNDTLANTTLTSALLLTSDLKGTIEDPGYYPAPSTQPRDLELDNLLLTQGWVSYDWPKLLQPVKSPLSIAEGSFVIHGKAINMFNKPIDKSGIVLFSKKPLLVLDTVTDKAGLFSFHGLYPADSAVYVIQARNKHGGSFNTGIEVAEFKPPVFTASTEKMIPWYVNADTAAITTLRTQVTYKNEFEKQLGSNLLGEVAITAKKIIKDSKNLNGPGGSDLALNEADMEKAGKITLGDLLAQKITGFHLGSGKQPFSYFINDQLLHLIIDGVDINFIGSSLESKNPTASRDFFNTYLDYYTAEDIKGIELMKSGKYANSYFDEFVRDLSDPSTHAYIEVTTWGGRGPFLNKTPGVYLYRPLTFAPGAIFYSPGYRVKTSNPLPDTRKTIYWSPEIVTDIHGKASFSFYTADKPGTYTMIIEGTDMNGNIGSSRSKIIVN